MTRRAASLPSMMGTLMKALPEALSSPPLVKD
jgi:hypothetical protein